MNKQNLKEVYFSQEKSFFGKKSTFKNTQVKSITSVFSNIASMPQYNEIRKRYKVHKTIGKILLSHHLGYIVYATCRGDKLIIMAKNHIAQSELNYQKMTLLKYLKQTKDFKNITTISILRWDKELRTKNIPEFSLKEDKAIIKNPTFKERSYGIFENSLTNKKLANIVEEIRITLVQNS
jgi:hypothetical protein